VGLRTGNTFAGTAFTAYGAFWLSFWALVQFFLKDIPVAQVGNAVGLYLIGWGMFTLVMFVASFRTSRAIKRRVRLPAHHVHPAGHRQRRSASR
jgi:succinate-acetate transporter protein